MKQRFKALLAALVGAALLAAPALAAAEPQTQQEFAPWAYSAVADSYAMGLVDDGYGTYITSPITQEQLESMTAVVAGKLALLELPQRTGSEALVIDTTRGGVMNALYQECAAYELPGVEDGVEAFLSSLGVVQGSGAGLAQERPCTYQEAMVMAQRLILAVYDSQDAGSKGLLWKAVNGDNTLYLLGTIHMDRSNVYPMHRSLREALLSADTVAFELDFNDAEGIAEFAAMQTYSDGTTLADHIRPELYQRVVAAFVGLGMPEEQTALYKPWALANSLSALSMTDDTTSSNAMAIDLYCNSLATWADIPVQGVETYVLQGNIFDTLDPEYLEAYLEGTLLMYEAAMEGAEPDPEVTAAVEANEKTLDAMFTAWKNRDMEAFSAAYNKQAIVSSEDQLQSRLFTDRDPGMIKAAAAFLEQEGSHTTFMAVGAGHMDDPGGIVSGLRALGYTVELVP